MENEEKLTEELEETKEFGGVFHERDTFAENNVDIEFYTAREREITARTMSGCVQASLSRYATRLWRTTIAARYRSSCA